MGIHATNKFGILTLGHGFLSADVISHKERGGLSFSFLLAWMIEAEQVACCWCSFFLGRTTTVASNLYCINECLPLLYL